MPFTLFAHQAPVVPMASRWAGRLDGIALVLGSMAPDLARFSSSLGFGGFGVPLWIDGHRLSVQPWLAVWTALGAVVVRRWLLPVTARCVPRGTRWHLEDLQLVATRRHRLLVVWWSALLGAATHLALDAITHDNRSSAELLPFLRIELFRLDHRRYLSVAGLLQIVLSLVLGVWCLRATIRAALERRLPARYGLTPAEADAVVRTYPTWIRAVVIAAAGIAVGIGSWIVFAFAQNRSGRTLVMATVVAGLVSLAVVTAMVSFLVDRRTTPSVTNPD